MENFKEIFKQHLNEATWKNLRKSGVNVVPNKRIMYAIENRKQVDLDYIDGNNIKHHRNVEIYAYGISKAHNQIIRAFQTWGSSETMGQNQKGWRTFRVDRIARMRVLDTYSSFDEAPNKRFGGVARYKKNDKDMIYMFKQVDFGPRTSQQQATKTEQEPAIEKPKQIFQQEPIQQRQQGDITASQQTAPEANDTVMTNIASQSATNTQPNGPVNPDTGEGFRKEFNDKVAVIKDKLEQDSENIDDDNIGELDSNEEEIKK